MKTLDVVFLPWMVDQVPYQKSLADQLEKRGARVRSMSDLGPFWFFGKKPDILHFHWTHAVYLKRSLWQALIRFFMLISGVLILRVRGTRIIWTAHNLKHHENPRPLLDYLCTAFVAKSAHGIIAHCHAAKDLLTRKFHIQKKEKVFVIPQGNYIDCYENKMTMEEARRVLGIPASKTVFLFLGFVRPYKGIFELVEAFKRIDPSLAELVIAGESHEDEVAASLREAVAGSPHIHFFSGFVPEDKIQVYLNACDVAVFPYRDVLTSAAAMLAMSFGRACIVSSKGCLPETLDPHGAFFYRPDDTGGLFESLNQAVRMREKLAGMGEHNRRLAEAMGWDKVAEMTFGLYVL